VADMNLLQGFRAAVRHENWSLADLAVITGMTASPVGIDRPAKRHVGCLGDLVDDRLRVDLVERDPAELWRVEPPYDGALLEQGNGHPAGGFPLGVAGD